MTDGLCAFVHYNFVSQHQLSATERKVTYPSENHRRLKLLFSPE